MELYELMINVNNRLKFQMFARKWERRWERGYEHVNPNPSKTLSLNIYIIYSYLDTSLYMKVMIIMLNYSRFLNL